MRQRADDLDPVLGEERRQVGLRRQAEHGEVAAVEHVTAEPRAPFDEPAEMRVELRRAAGDVDRRDGRPPQHFDALRHRLAGHDLPPVGTRVDVAVHAGLVAELADVDLQDLDAGRTQGGQTAFVERLGEFARQREAAQRRQLLARRRQRKAPRRERPGSRGRRPGRRGRYPRRVVRRRHIPTRFAWLRICTPWTSEAPPRMADATCTASVIWSRSAPFSSASAL